MPVFHYVRVNDDVYKLIEEQAKKEKRSVTVMTDILLSDALDKL